MKTSIVALTALLSLIPISHAEQVELVSVEPLKHEKAVTTKVEYPAISCTFESIFNLEKGMNILAMRLSNSSEVPVKVSKLLIGLDESYEVRFNGQILPNAFNNHQANNEVEVLREKRGLRWLVVPPKSSVLVSHDPTDWQSLENLSSDHKMFEIELFSKLFRSQKVLLRYKLIQE